MGEGYENVHINWTSPQKYLPRVRLPGCRKYRLVGRPRKTREAALLSLAREFAKGIYKRGDVLMVAADPTEDWYGPRIVDEIVRRG